MPWMTDATLKNWTVRPKAAVRKPGFVTLHIRVGVLGSCNLRSLTSLQCAKSAAIHATWKHTQNATFKCVLVFS